MIEYELYNEDCIERMKYIPDNSIDLIITDPPYGISYKSNKQKGDTRKGKEIKVREDDYFNSIEGDDKLNTIFIPMCYDKLKIGGALYIFCHWSKWSEIEKIVKDSGFTVKNMIVMNKSNHGMGDLKGSYAPKHELLLFATKGRHLLSGKRINDIYDCKVIYSGSFHYHPNEKPYNWILPFIERSCKENGFVLDPFMGSGSTGVACIKSNRNFIGIEIDKGYFDIAKTRIEKEAIGDSL